MNKSMYNTKIHKKVVILLIIICFFLLGGCGIFNKNSKQQPQQEEQSEKIPKQLEEIETSIEKIFMDLDGPAIEKKEDSKQKQDDVKKPTGEDQGTEQGKEGEGEQQSQGQKDKQEQGAKQEGQDSDPWQQVTQGIKTLHSSWNEYMPEATKKGARKDLIDDFGDALNDLTKIAEGKDKMKTLLAASNLHKYIPDLYALYKTKASPELKRVIYYTRNLVLNSMSEDWVKATSDMDELKSTWSLVKTTIGKEQQEDSTKLDLSIYELEKVIKEKDKNLVQIKGKITLSNIESLQKSMEKGGSR